jgi:hypothetical protein
MPKFYEGQPIVCIWDRAKWLSRNCGYNPYTVPVLGKVYRVGEYYGLYPVPLHIYVQELPSDTVYSEDGFEPLTKNLVQDLLQVTAPVDARPKELEDA